MKNIFILLILFLCACSTVDNSTKTYTIKYEVIGTGACIDASLTYENKTGDSAQISAASLPWNYSFTTTDTSQFLYISAQNNYSSGTVTTRIYVDNTVKKETTSSGSFVIATSSGTIKSF